jgi:phage-related protein
MLESFCQTPEIQESNARSIPLARGMPLCRPLGAGLWEVRSNLPSNRIARVMFCFRDGHLVALHGFIKKIQKTPADELELARKRKDEVS